jgi:tRNA U54 and U55 pseudouridine synthase Pus10
MDLEKYFEIAKKYCTTEPYRATIFAKPIYACEIKNPFTKFEIKFNFENKTITLGEKESKIVIKLEPPFYTYYSYPKNGKEISITKWEIEKDFELENFEKTLKSILHLPSYIKYKIKKYLEKV